jgi:hypothetical protein
LRATGKGVIAGQARHDGQVEAMRSGWTRRAIRLWSVRNEMIRENVR